MQKISITTNDSQITIQWDNEQKDNYQVMTLLYYCPASGKDVQVDKSEETDPTFTIDKDGCYKIVSIAIPKQKTADSSFYMNGDLIYRSQNDSKTDILEILDYIEEGKPGIKYNISYTFSILNLHACYIRLCEETLKSCLGECEVKEKGFTSARVKRDFVWAAINVIKYYVGFSQFEKAQKLLEKILGCNGICNTLITTSNHGSGCGCYKAS